MLVIRILAHLENLKRNRKSLKNTQDESQPQINYSSMLGAIAFGLLIATVTIILIYNLNIYIK